ncbi:MAG: hypothetical protein FWD17_00325 [Polyangiaceae bacterium]|nr:hypothetical protein [Polyangiaceae bacterium]
MVPAAGSWAEPGAFTGVGPIVRVSRTPVRLSAVKLLDGLSEAPSVTFSANVVRRRARLRAGVVAVVLAFAATAGLAMVTVRFRVGTTGAPVAVAAPANRDAPAVAPVARALPPPDPAQPLAAATPMIPMKGTGAEKGPSLAAVTGGTSVNKPAPARRRVVPAVPRRAGADDHVFESRE